MEVMELASGKLRDGFRCVGSQGISCGNKGHGSQPKGRGKLANAVEHLFAIVPFVAITKYAVRVSKSRGVLMHSSFRRARMRRLSSRA